MLDADSTGMSTAPTLLRARPGIYASPCIDEREAVRCVTNSGTTNDAQRKSSENLQACVSKTGQVTLFGQPCIRLLTAYSSMLEQMRGALTSTRKVHDYTSRTSAVNQELWNKPNKTVTMHSQSLEGQLTYDERGHNHREVMSNICPTGRSACGPLAQRLKQVIHLHSECMLHVHLF